MDRIPLSATTRPHPQRAVSGNSALYFAKPQTRPPLPSRLSSVRSVSQPAHVIDLTADGSQRVGKHEAAYGGKRESVVTSPHVIEVDDDELEDDRPPAKRAKITTEGFRAEIEDEDMDVANAVVAGERLPSLLMPKVPTARTATVQRRHGGEHARKSNGLEAPAMATRLPPPKHVADFSPWTGHHPEDVMNEAVVKAGYCDKGFGTSQSEFNSAKPSIWPNLSSKNNTGLQMLNHLFIHVLDKRQALGKCSAPSTFKPPPRVTVTDTKREAWLKDLANPEIPLRKQSRTIPHGIRGKLLMDQCLNKDIPLQRAVWLAKCVGANELRAFKRKGVSGIAAATGESKWVYEWTVHVEQFLEGVMDGCSQQDWQMKMTYAVKLASAFYAERLLDLDHYLNWVVSSFNEASSEKLPLWIVIVQNYWKDIVGFVRRGRRLAESMLERLHSITNDGLSVNGALKLRLQKLVTVLAVTSRGCLIMPATWRKYAYLLTSASPPAGGKNLLSPAENMARRNERLVGPLSKTPANTRSALLRLYDTLDTAGLDYDAEGLTSQCLSWVSNLEELVTALLEWASSPYRYGIARTYLAARIIVTLSEQGHNTDAAVLAYLAQPGMTSAKQDEHVYKVIGELVRLGAFNVGPYLQWLISSGAMYATSEMQRARGLLAAVPASSLPVHVASVRQTLLGRLEDAVDARIAAAAIIEDFESAIVGQSLQHGTENSLIMSLPVKLAVADHIRDHLRSRSKLRDVDVASFCIMRRYLDPTDDIATIAELIESALQTDDSLLLASATDTAALHFEAIAALGRLWTLTEAIHERYRVLRSQQPLDRTLILSLTSLVHLVHGRGAISESLTSDLVICEQQNTAAVCSPASDNLIGMQASSLESDRDIDAVFASGNTMDDQLLQRVFRRILLRAGKSIDTNNALVSKLSSWLNQLRVVGGSSFDKLVDNYYQSALKGTGTSINPQAAFTSLVASDCLGLDTIIKSAQREDGSYAAKLSMDLLLYPSPNPSLSTLEKYSYLAAQRSCCWHHPEAVTRLLITACDRADFDFAGSAVTDLLIQYTSARMPVVKAAFENASASRTLPARARGISRAMLERGMQGKSYDDLDLHVIIDIVGPLSIRFAAGELWWSAKTATVTGEDTEGVAESVLIEAIQDGNSVWPQLLGTAVDERTKRALHEWAQEQLFMAATRTLHAADADLQTIIDKYLDVLGLTYSAVQGAEDTAVLAALNDKLRDVDKILSNGTQGTRSDSDGPCRQLRILLRVCTLHIPAPVDENDNNRQARGDLLLTLCSIFVQPHVQMQPEMAEHIFDLASAVSDSIPEAVLASIARTVKTTDPHIRAILGSPPATTDSWLALVSQVQSSGGTAQQRALARHASGQASSGRPGGQAPGAPTPQQRAWPFTGPANRPIGEEKTTPFPLRRWEIMPDPTPVMGENDTSLSLGLFGARKV